MEDLIIEKTRKTPGVNLTPGALLFYGRSIIDNTRDFYQPVYDWICKYLENPANETEVIMKLEYIDAPSVNTLMNLLKIINEIRERGLIFKVKWFYEYGDLEMLQLGSILQSRLEIEFDFHEFEPDGLMP